MNICPMAAKLFHADGQTDRHDEANRVAFRNFAIENECGYTFTIAYALMVCRETSTSPLFAKTISGHEHKTRYETRSD
jgi:hypothetical protein